MDLHQCLRARSGAHRPPATPHRHWEGCSSTAQAYRLPTVPCTLRACRPAYDRVCTLVQVCLRPRGARPPLPAPPVAAPTPRPDRNQLRRRFWTPSWPPDPSGAHRTPLPPARRPPAGANPSLPRAPPCHQGRTPLPHRPASPLQASTRLQQLLQAVPPR